MALLQLSFVIVQYTSLDSCKREIKGSNIMSDPRVNDVYIS